MSTGLECHVVEAQPGQWHYLLQDGDGPTEARDWREYATMSRAFSSSEEALSHLASNHANPGGWSLLPFSDQVAADPVLRAHLRRLTLGHHSLRVYPQALLREMRRGEWFLFLEDMDSTDETPSFLANRAAATGPFPSLEVARAYMLAPPAGEPAPVGYSSQSYERPAGWSELQEREHALAERLIADAAEPDAERLKRALSSLRPGRFTARYAV